MDFSVILKAILDSTNIEKNEIPRIQKILEKQMLNITATIDKKHLYSEVKKIIPTLESSLKAIGINIKINDSMVTTAINQVIKDEQRLQAETDKTQRKLSDMSSKIQVNLDTGKYSAEISKMNADLQKYNSVQSSTFQSAKQSASALASALRSIETASTTKERVAAEQNYQKCLATTKNLLTQVKTEYDKNNTLVIAGDQKRTALIAKLNNYLSQNTAIGRQNKATIESWISTLASSDDMTVGSIRNINNEFTLLDSKLRRIGKLGLSFTDSIKQQASKFGQWLSVSALVLRGIHYIKRGIVSIKELDTALVDLKKTAKATSAELDSFYYDANDTAKALGATTKEIISQASEWSRLGYSIKDVQTMAKNSAIFDSISPDIDIQKATDGLVSVLKAYSIDAEDALDGVISKINILGNTQAVSNGDLVEVLTRSSSAMAAANNTLEQTLALGTAA